MNHITLTITSMFTYLNMFKTDKLYFKQQAPVPHLTDYSYLTIETLYLGWYFSFIMHFEFDFSKGFGYLTILS